MSHVNIMLVIVMLYGSAVLSVHTYNYTVLSHKVSQAVHIVKPFETNCDLWFWGYNDISIY